MSLYIREKSIDSGSVFPEVELTSCSGNWVGQFHLLGNCRRMNMLGLLQTRAGVQMTLTWSHVTKADSPLLCLPPSVIITGLCVYSILKALIKMMSCVGKISLILLMRDGVQICGMIQAFLGAQVENTIPTGGRTWTLRSDSVAQSSPHHLLRRTRPQADYMQLPSFSPPL